MIKTFQYFSEKHGCLTEVSAISKQEVVEYAKENGDNIKLSDVACPGAREHKITLVSHYNKRRLSIMVPLLFKYVLADNVRDGEPAMGEINEDIDRFRAGYPFRFLTYSQYKKITGFFGKNDTDYFSDVEF